MIGFIGCGSMGGALARAAAKAVPAADILLTNRTRGKAERLAEELGVQVSDNETAARRCRFRFREVFRIIWMLFLKLCRDSRRRVLRCFKTLRRCLRACCSGGALPTGSAVWGCWYL